jgi:tRNA pseudouridine55 synthase
MEDPLPGKKLIDGSCLLVDKPFGWTSFDVVNKIRTAIKHNLSVKKIKVGHAGTLDPSATGLLIICTGKSTKKIQSYQQLEKEYTGIITLGITTPSYDSETEPDANLPTEHITLEQIEETRTSFLGEIEQIPPMFSAIKVDGQPLYKKARLGEIVDVAPRPVNIYSFTFTKIELPNLYFHIKCSKGTYIRSIANEFGRKLECGAYLSSLCRTAIGPHTLSKAWNLEDLIEHIDNLLPGN